MPMPQAMALQPNETLTRAWIDRPYFESVALDKEEAAKLGLYTAYAIEDALADHGWPDGTVCGPDEVLAYNFDVDSRRLRQAYRLLEARGVCRIQRGPSGGIVVLKPRRRAAATAVFRHLTFTGVSDRELWQARRVIEPLILDALLISPAFLSRREVVHSEDLIDCLDNPSLALCFESVECFPLGFMQGDTATAVRILHLLRLGAREQAHDLWHDHIDIRQVRHAAGSERSGDRGTCAAIEGHSLASTTATRLNAELTREKCRPGDHVGSLADLAERYGVGLPVMVEAVRLLEDSGVLKSQRGRGGGVLRATPSQLNVLRLTHSYLASTQKEEDDSFLTTWMLNRATVALSADASRGSRAVAAARIVPPAGLPFLQSWFLVMRDIYDGADNAILHTLVRCLVGYEVRRNSATIPDSLAPANAHQLMSQSHALMSEIRVGRSARAVDHFETCHRLLRKCNSSQYKTRKLS